MSEVTRRRVLAASGAVAMGAVAGCTSSAEEDEEEPEPEPEGTVLGDIAIENLSAVEREVNVQVDVDGDLEHWSKHTIESGSGDALDRGWPTGPTNFRVRALLDGEGLLEVSPETWNEPDCLNLLIVIDRTGDLEILSTPEGGPCAAADGSAEDDPAADD